MEVAVIMDSDGMVVSWTPLARKMFGYQAEEAERASLGELIVPEAFRPFHEAGLRRYVQTREPHCVGHLVEIEALHKEGHSVPVQMKIVPREEGEALFFDALMASR